MRKGFSSFLSLLAIPCLAFAESGGAENVNVIELVFSKIVAVMASVLFWSIPGFPMPLILLTLLFGGVYFTFRYGFVNVKLFRHSLDVIAGKYDNPKDKGEISHFQALTSALSATVGLGNIAGVAVAIATGGPGAIFWMWIVAFFGMSMKFSSCTLAQLHRRIDEKGHVLGGPFIYLEEGLKERFSIAGLGKTFGVLFAIFTISGSLGGGNMFQANQTYELLANQFPVFQSLLWKIIIGLILAFLVGIVIIGGIKRIGEVTSKLVPIMCIFYVLCCLGIIFSRFSQVPAMFASIFTQAFTPQAMFGGFIGVLIQGVKRASFSNEAGLGSAAIAHSAARTDEPVREGVVAMIGPFIDTHVVCTMTALAILITGAHLDPELAGKGAAITSKAFGTLGSVFPLFLTVGVAFFAYSTIISWSYYGERATEYLFGMGAIPYYRVMYVMIVVLGPILTLGSVIDFSDLAILTMAFPNIVGMIFLSYKIKPLLADYIKRLKAGEMKTYK